MHEGHVVEFGYFVIFRVAGKVQRGLMQGVVPGRVARAQVSHRRGLLS